MNASQCVTAPWGREESQLFLIRLWVERDNKSSSGDEGNDLNDPSATLNATLNPGGRGSLIEWCGRLQHVVSGEAQYIRGLPTLMELLLDMARTGAPDGAEHAPPGGTTQAEP